MHKHLPPHRTNKTTQRQTMTPSPPKIGRPVILLWALPDHKLPRFGRLWRWRRSHVCLSVSATRIWLLPFRRLLPSGEQWRESPAPLVFSTRLHLSGSTPHLCCWPFLIARQRSHVAVTQSRPAQETVSATGWVEMRWMPPERFVCDNVFISNGTTSWSLWESSREVLHANLRKYTFNWICSPAIPRTCNFYYKDRSFLFLSSCSEQLLLYE